VTRHRIKSLTEEQERALVEFRQRMWRQATSCEPVDRAVATKAIANAYAAVGRAPPTMLWMPSPATCVLALYALGKLSENPQWPDAARMSVGLGIEIDYDLSLLSLDLWCEHRYRLARKLAANLKRELAASLEQELMSVALRTGVESGLADWPDRLKCTLKDRLEAELRDGLGVELKVGLVNTLKGELSADVAQDLYYLSVDGYFLGQMDTRWLAYYRFGSIVGRVQESLLNRLGILERIAASCGYWFPRDGVCIVSDRFASVHWNNARSSVGFPTHLHHGTKQAVSFRDGWGLYYWHGLRIPPSHEWLFTNRAKLSVAKIEKEPNAELRRVMLEIYGFERYLAEREARVIASDELHGQPRKLYEVNVGGEPVRIVEVVNGSLEPDGTRRKFHLGAARDSNRQPPNTPHESIANSYGIAPEHYREAVRT